MLAYPSVIDALSDNNLAAAKDILLTEIMEQTQNLNSWDSPHYVADRSIQESLVQDQAYNKNITFFGLENLRDRYFLRDANRNICEDPQKFFARVATGIARGDREFAQSLYEVMAKGWWMPATPVLTNIGTKRALPISCFLNTVEDSLGSIFETFAENAFISKGGGGVGTDWSQLRGQNAPLSTGAYSSGVIPFLKIMDSATLAVSQNSTRRGAGAAYLRIDHPDVLEFLEIRRTSGGDVNRQCQNINHGLLITDEFMEAVERNGTYWLIDPHTSQKVQELQAQEIWRKILKIRVETGEPYLLFIDTVNRATPQHHAEKGLWVRQSNLCAEITLPTNSERTAVCCLGSLNLEKYDEWRVQIEGLTYLAVKALDNVLDAFLEMADPKAYAKAINSVKHERSIGLGVMGYHGYLMSRNIPFETIAARIINKQIFSQIQLHAKNASKRLAGERGLPLDGGEQRNSYILSIAPTASISFLCGEATPCIEPISGNAYLQKTLSGSFLVKNKYLEQLLEQKGFNTSEVWKNIIAAKGSVQHLDILSEDEKKVFRTAYEMNMREIVEQAADRQKYLCQSQSLNLFFQNPISGRYLQEVHKLAWQKGVKSLYYVRSTAPIQAEMIERGTITIPMPIKRDVSIEECAVCQ
jgi:ribonucleoside-diphosphate reductase alpha chain